MNRFSPEALLSLLLMFKKETMYLQALFAVLWLNRGMKKRGNHLGFSGILNEKKNISNQWFRTLSSWIWKDLKLIQKNLTIVYQRSIHIFYLSLWNLAKFFQFEVKKINIIDFWLCRKSNFASHSRKRLSNLLRTDVRSNLTNPIRFRLLHTSSLSI